MFTIPYHVVRMNTVVCLLVSWCFWC